MGDRHLASDGLVARESGRWAEDKLYYLQRYFYAFNQATKAIFERRVYIDLLAGPGRCFLKDNPSEEFSGSPLRALLCESPFTDHLFIEGDPKSVTALEARLEAFQPGAGSLVHRGDANAPETIARIRELLNGRKTLGLVFVDTLGLSDVAFDTLRQLAESRRFDLIYTFHEQDVTRNMNEALINSAEAARWTASFGNTDWAIAWRAHVSGQAGTVSIADALTSFFEFRLQDGLGYPHVTSLHRLMKNSRNAPLYRLILASHDDLAPKLWRGISAIEPSGQRGFAF